VTEILLRVATPADATTVQAIYAPIVRETFISFELEAPSVEEMATRIATTLETYPYLVAEWGGEVVGYAYAGAHRTRAAYQWSVDVTAYVAPHAQRQGVGHQLYVRLLDLLAAQGFHRAFAGIALPNDASVALHESVGFTPIGRYPDVGFKLGEWRDVGWWSRPLRSGPPGPITPFDRLLPFKS
jgi:phosphinothricin acetyltransferase